MKTTLLTTLFSLSLLSACTNLAPNYTRPMSVVDDHLPVYQEKSEEAPLAGDLSWQEFVLNPQLREVIRLGLENNRNLRVAALNVQKSRALFRVEKSDQYPNINTTAGGLNRGLSSSQS